jgi:hypothetical protein
VCFGDVADDLLNLDCLWLSSKLLYRRADQIAEKDGNEIK